MLKLIGWWIKTLADEELPAPQEFVGQLPSKVRMALVNYLASGSRLIQYRGYSWCRFDCGVKHSIMGSRDLTDGTWVWPEGLAHYVEVHSVILPDEFMSCALSGTRPTQRNGSPERPPDYDAEYWVRWCSARRSVDIKEALRSALIAAQARVSAIKEERADALERKHGLSSERCNWIQCSRKALAGRLVCAAHSLNGADVAIAEIPLYTGLQECLRQLPGRESKV